jgi:hypothetical protein
VLQVKLYHGASVSAKKCANAFHYMGRFFDALAWEMHVRSEEIRIRDNVRRSQFRRAAINA